MEKLAWNTMGVPTGTYNYLCYMPLSFGIGGSIIVQ